MLTLDGYTVRQNEAIEISFPVLGTPKITAYGSDYACAHRKFFPQDECTGCNSAEVVFSPHMHGTHIEYHAHVRKQWPPNTTEELLKLPALMLAKLINAVVKDQCVVDFVAEEDGHIEAVVLNSGWLDRIVKSSTNDIELTSPTNQSIYIDPGVISKLKAMFPRLQVLLFDSISVDPAIDGGKLLSHRQFFDGEGERTRFIVELCHIPQDTKEGLYALSLNVAAFQLDAVPCRPVLYPLVIETQSN